MGIQIKKIGSALASQRLRIITVVLFMAVGTYLLTQSQAAAGYIYISPTTANKHVGNTFSVQVRIKTTSPINAAFVDINYNGIGLQVLSIQRGADFPNQNAPTQHTPSSTGTGRIKMQSTRNNSATGDFHYATITFKATKTGTYGVSPIGSSHLINYPSGEVSFTYGRGDYTFTTAPPPPPPPPTPTPTPTPAPKPTPKPTPRPSSSTPAPSATPSSNVPKTESAPSASNLKIFDFAITNLTYRSAVVSWKTNEPATSKANYGYSSNDMPYEITGKEKTTTHKLLLQGDTIRAGNQYAVRITSDDGKGPVTLDGSFSTKGIKIIVKVTDPQNQPVAGALVYTDALEVTTGDDGTGELIVPEDSVTISAQKDDLSGNLIAEIVLPESEDALPQQVAITLNPPSDTSAKSPAKSNQRSPLWIILPLLLFVGIGFLVLVLFVRRKRQQAAYRGPSVTIVSDPTIGPSTHYPTLPELVKQDLGAKNKRSPQPEEEPVDMFSNLDKPPATPPPMHQPVKHHTHTPEPKAPEPHPHAKPHEAEAPQKQHHTPEKPHHPPAHHKEAEVDPKDNSLHINHDD
jgi:hypothetical protein